MRLVSLNGCILLFQIPRLISIAFWNLSLLHGGIHFCQQDEKFKAVASQNKIITTKWLPLESRFFESTWRHGLSHYSRVGLLLATSTTLSPPPPLQPRWSRNGPDNPTLSLLESRATTSHLYPSIPTLINACSNKINCESRLSYKY